MKVLAKLCGIIMVLLLLIACEKNEEPKVYENQEEFEVLKVAVNEYFLGTPLYYILENQMDLENELKIEMFVYPSGVKENEAIQSGEVDVALIGGAFVFGVVEADTVVIAEYIKSEGVNGIYAKSDHEVFKVKGFNPTYTEVYGDYDSVAGNSIVLEKGTTAQLLVSKWLSSIGVKEEDVQMIDRDFDTSFEYLKSGKTDFASLVAPYSFEANKMGYKLVVSFNELNSPIYEVIVASQDSYNNNKDVLVKFLDLVYQANLELESDPAIKKDYVVKWYKQIGKFSSYEQIEEEIKQKTFITKEMIKDLNFGEFEEKYAVFMASTGSLNALDVKKVKDHIRDDILKSVMNIN